MSNSKLALNIIKAILIVGFSFYFFTQGAYITSLTILFGGYVLMNTDDDTTPTPYV